MTELNCTGDWGVPQRESYHPAAEISPIQRTQHCMNGVSAAERLQEIFSSVSDIGDQGGCRSFMMVPDAVGQAYLRV